MSLLDEHKMDQIKVRLEKLGALRKTGENPYKNGFRAKNFSDELHRKYNAKTKEELELEEPVAVSVAGRIMAIRSFGKAAFVRVKDTSGEIQLFVQKAKLGDEVFDYFKTFDIGDIIYSHGILFKTKTNELSVNIEELVLVTKSLRPLPEKFHGIADVEIRYRQRYLDLIMNSESKAVFLKRSKAISAMRRFFEEQGFVEVETPMMHPIAGGAAARPFKTHHNTLDMELFLRIAPELYLKRLTVGGIDKVFEINRNFRNEGISIQHNPEFTMVEFYWAYATYDDLIPLTQELVQQVAIAVTGSPIIEYQGQKIDFSGDWKRITVEDAIIEYSGFKQREDLRNPEKLRSYLEKNKFPIRKNDGPGKMMLTIFEEEVESKLIDPTFVTQYPLEVSPLSRQNEKDAFLVDRFELFIYGREIANGFSELNDPVDQYQRFLSQVEAKDAGDEEACEMDEDYVRALEYGMPPAAGEGIGIDRLVMLLTDSASIRDVILFPQLRKQLQ